MKLTLAVTIFFSSYAVFANSPKEYITISGARYTLVEKNVPVAIQPAYVDKDNLIWGAALRDSKGDLLQASAGQAEQLCNSIVLGGNSTRLPTLNEYLKLRESMSSSEGDINGPTPESRINENRNYVVDHPALPDIANVFHTSTIFERSYRGMFYGVSGLLTADNAAFGSSCGNIYCAAVRCVVPKNYLESSKPVEVYTTVTGINYKFEPKAPPKMQPAYRDHKGLVWGDVLKDSQNVNLLLNQGEAIEACSQIKLNNLAARLPTGLELLRLRESMSTSPNNWLQNSYSPGGNWNDTFSNIPALPSMNLGKSFIWSSTSVLSASDPAYNNNIPSLGIALNTSNGNLMTWYINEPRYARCVIDL